MWFRKAKQSVEPCRFPGTTVALDGHSAALAVDSMSADQILVQSGGGTRELTGPLSRLLPPGQARIEPIAELKHLPAALTGMCATGLRSTAFVDSMAGMADGLSGMVGKHLATVIHLASRCRQRQAWALHGSHDDYLSISQSGSVQLFARNVQEVADLSLIARRIAESAMMPVVCAQDFHSTAQAVQSLHLPEPELARVYLGEPGDSVPATTKAQAILLGEKHRRIPRLLDIDNPAGMGGVQGPDSYFRAVAAQHAFFAESAPELVANAMREYAGLTRREYQPVGSYRVEDADVVVLAMGAVVDQLCACVDHLRESEGLKAGVLNLTLWRPFPGAALTELLKGKKAVTVLESTETPLAEDLPMVSEVRSALAKAVENSNAKAAGTVHPGYPIYGRGDRVPSVYSAIYGVGTSLPSLVELIAVVRNMMPDGAGRRRAYVGVDFARVSRSYPHLQVLQQRLAGAYPDLNAIGLPPADVTPPEFAGQLVRVHALAGEGGIEAGNLFARALAAGLDLSVSTYSQGGVESGLQRANLDIQFAASYPTGHYQAANMMLVAGSKLLQEIPGSALREGGHLVVSANQTPEQLWRGMSRRVTEWIKTRRLSVTLVDARAIAITGGEGPGHLDQLSIWALLGCALTLIRPDQVERQAVIEALEVILARLFDDDRSSVKEILNVMERASKEAVSVEWEQWKNEVRPPEVERPAPWSADAPGANTGDLFDPSRFWRSVGFLYDCGDEDQTLLDPYLATGVMPARSSAHRDMASYRLTLPRWLPENCTGCGLCWSHCPDSALPPTVQGVDALINTGIRLCKEEGQAMTQLSRIAGHLSTQAYKLFAKDDLHQYTKAGALLSESFKQLVGKMGLEGDALVAMSADFELVKQRLKDWPVARSERYFTSAAKGEGKLLSIAVNPVNCKACGLCMAVCPDAAMTWESQTPEVVELQAANLDLQMQMPEVPVKDLAAMIDPDDLDSEMSRLLNRSSYLSMVGGDSALPGHPGKTAVHLVAAAMDSVMQQRYREHEAYLAQLMGSLQQKIQDQLSGTVRIDDFKSFSARLSAVEQRKLNSQDLAAALGKQALGEGLDQARLDRLGSLLTRIEAQLASFRSGRSRMVLALQRGEITLWSGSYPDNPHASPWLSHEQGEAPALAEGLFEGMSRRLIQELAICRQAELELKDQFDPAQHGRLASTLVWDDLTEKERGLLAPVVMVAEAESVHWDDIFKVLTDERPITLLLLDQQGMSLGARDSGGPGLQHSARALNLGTRFVVQGATGNPAHLIRAAAASLDSGGPSLITVYAPDPMDNALSGEYVAEDAGLALRSRAIPLFCFDPGRTGAPLSLEGNPEPALDWANWQLEGRDSAGAAETLEIKLTPADWAVHQLRFRSCFTLLRKGQLASDMRPLVDYLDLEPGQRTGLQPYIRLLDGRKKPIIAKVSADMAAACESTLQAWKALRARASGVAVAPARVPASQALPLAAPAEPAAALVGDEQALVERLLALCGYASDPAYFRQSLRDFLAKESGGQDKGAENVAH